MLNVANAITLLRFALIPVIVLALLRHEYGSALVLFIVSALSDVADGVVARHWSQRTRFGAVADPLADKLTMLAVTLLLAAQGGLPWWMAAAVVLRDLVIVGGAAAYYLLIGPPEMAPSTLSKLNTALEFLLLASILAIGAQLLAQGSWRDVLLWTTFATVVLSGGHYVVAWTRKAISARRGAKEL